MSNEEERLFLLSAYERSVKAKGFKVIAGVDEAGRGPLAGPVVAAACILPDKLSIVGIDDSKKLTSKRRFLIYRELIQHPEVEYGLGIVQADRIDQINILQATLEAMTIAINGFKIKPAYLLIDGDKLPLYPLPMSAIIGGDRLSVSIAAASIIAKETRDELMRQYDLKWPHYGFGEHKGYGTKKHLAALEKYGPSPIHRMSFEPLKSIVQQA